jgi:uncharacterized membrane protein
MYRYYLKTLIKTWFNCSRSDNSDFRFPPILFIVTSQESERSYICVLMVCILPLSTTLILEFGTVMKVSYFCFIILCQVYWLVPVSEHYTLYPSLSKSIKSSIPHASIASSTILLINFLQVFFFLFLFVGQSTLYQN